MKYRLFHEECSMKSTKLTLVEEGDLQVGSQISLDISTNGYISVEVAPGVWINVTVSEWGDLSVDDKPSSTKRKKY